MEDKIRNKECIKSTEELKEYLSERAYNHHYFKHYTRQVYAENIFKSHSIFLSNGNNWNDITDRNLFNKERNLMRFGVCFSATQSENVAMWMLYSGNNGCMIDFSPNIIKEILKVDKIYLGYFENKEFRCDSELSVGEFEISIVDILYHGASSENSNSYYVKRADEVNREISKKYVDDLPYCKKSIAWSYENECRLIVSVNRKFITNDEIDTVKIEFPEKLIEELKERTYDSPNVRDKNRRYKDSKLRDNMAWDLTQNCDNYEICRLVKEEK